LTFPVWPLTVVLLSAAGAGLAAPPLPPGLSEGQAPTVDNVPALPPGLGDAGIGKAADDRREDAAGYPAATEVSGFWEYRYGERLRDTDLHGQTSLNETRLHVALDQPGERLSFEAAADFLYDDLAASRQIDLESGEGWFDLRRLNLLWKPLPAVDLRLGRQIITWGTGDRVFLNDTFPKDSRYWLGRDIEYVKAPSDAARVSWYTPLANLDVVYTPRFDASRYVNGERLSFWSDPAGRLVGRDDVIDVAKPARWFEDDELALRLYRNYEGAELALYAYDGFYRSPAGFDPNTGKFLFPRLRTLGASARTPVGRGILNLEFAHWASRDDADGTDPFISNGENRYLLGYEWEARRDFTVNLQYYATQMHDHGSYTANLPADVPERPAFRHTITVGLTRLLLGQKLRLSWFSLYTPRNGDFYARPEVNYQIDDQWSLEIGANWFDNANDEPFAELGQFKYNSNVYGMVRYSFADGI
jgi:hypothetical protein